jgi:SAM-dependent methyltransferase
MSATATANVVHSSQLDVGCGYRKLPGFLGIDGWAGPGVDVVHDLDVCPWPFSENSFSLVVCRHSLGHLDDIVAAVEELYRITAPGGIIEIVSPHFSSDNFFTDVTHRRAFGYRSMDYFCVNRDCVYRYSTKAKFRLAEVRISFVQAKAFDRRKLNPFRWFGLEWLVNRFPRFYEHFLAFVLRANEVYFRLEVIKP